MCGPEVFTALAMQQMGGTTPGGTGLKIQAGAQALDVLTQLAEGSTRANLARADAQRLRMAGEEKARRIRTAGDIAMSQQRAATTGVGVSLNSDSVLELERRLARNVEQDAGVAILSGRNRADSAEMSARFYRQAGVMGALDDLVGVADKWRRSKFADMPPMSGRQLNPVGDGVVLDPQAGW